MRVREKKDQLTSCLDTKCVEKFNVALMLASLRMYECWGRLCGCSRQGLEGEREEGKGKHYYLAAGLKFSTIS